jgi:hypothetical protein
MDTGDVVLHVVTGVPTVVRCEAATQGWSFIAALNASELCDGARQALEEQGIGLERDGLYPCPLELQTAARFPPLVLPSDLLTPAAARDMLYPDLSPKAGWERVHRAIQTGKLRAYTIGGYLLNKAG